jgi:hypothetical protein
MHLAVFASILIGNDTGHERASIILQVHPPAATFNTGATQEVLDNRDCQKFCALSRFIND